MDKVQATIQPNDEVGQGTEYESNEYHYRAGKIIPKNKAAALRWEGNWFGRSHGEVRYIIVAWNGKDFTVLESISGGIRKDMYKYKGISSEQAITLAEKHEKSAKAEWDAVPKCCKCKKPVVVLMKGQPNDICILCFEDKLQEKKKYIK